MAYDTVTLTGRYLHFDGVTPARGVIEIIPSVSVVIDAEGDAILSGRIKVPLDEAGEFSVELPATDDEALNPSGFGYTVAAKLSHKHLAAVSFALPAAVPEVDMADVVTVDPVTFEPGATYAHASELAALDTRVDAAETALATKETPAGAQAKADAAQAAAATDATTKASAAQAAAIAASEPVGLSAETEASLQAAYARLTAALAPSARQSGVPNVTMVGDLSRAGHGWSTSAAADSSNMNDTSTFARGSQCCTVTTKGDAQVVPIRNTGLTSFNSTDQTFEISVKVDNPENLAQMFLYVGDTAFANFRVLTMYNPPAGNTAYPFAAGEWVRITVDAASVTSTTGSPNIAAVTAVQVAFKDKGGGASGKVTAHVNHVGRFSKPSAFPSGVLSLVFDDGYASQFSVAKPYMDKFGYPGTAYVICDKIDNAEANYLTLAQARQLHDHSGWEVAAHALTTANHDRTDGFSTLSESALDAELAGLKAWLLSNGFARGADHFAYPKGLFSVGQEPIVRRYFASARSISRWPVETLPPGNSCRLRTFACNTPQTLQEAKDRVDAAVAGKSWGILTFHDIVTSPPTPPGTTIPQWSTADFQALMDYIATKSIPVRTVGDVMAALA